MALIKATFTGPEITLAFTRSGDPAGHVVFPPQPITYEMEAAEPIEDWSASASWPGGSDAAEIESSGDGGGGSSGGGGGG